MDHTRKCSSGDKEVRAEPGESHQCDSDPARNPSNRQAKHQPWKKFRLSGYEILGLIIVASMMFWVCGVPPSNPVDWFHWLLDTSDEHWHSPLWAIAWFLFYAEILLLTKVIWDEKRQIPRGFLEGSLLAPITKISKVRGVAILEVNPESIAREAGMLKGDVIVEYDSERDITSERLSAVIAAKGPETGHTSLVFVRDGRQHSRTLPYGPLGISVMDTAVRVPSETM